MLIRLWNMLDFKMRTVAAAAAVLTGCLSFMALPSSGEKMAQSLSALGLSVSAYEEIQTRPGQIVISNLTLDTDGFSMIGKIEAKGSPLFPIVGIPDRVDISDLQLTGEWNEEIGLSFAGWSFPVNMLNAQQTIDRIVLGSSIIDLDTPAGAIRLELSGEAARHPERDNLSLFNAHLSGKQLQLILDSRLKGSWIPDRGMALEAEIKEGRLNLEHMSAARISGWLALEPVTGSLVPELSGQIQAGQFSHNQLILQNVNLTFDGPLTQPRTIVTASLGGHQSASLLLETKIQSEGTEVLASVETKTMDDLIGVLSAFRASAETAPLLQEALMSLLITEGNIDRIKKDLKKEKYDSYVMEIQGYSHDLKGKIIAKKIKDGIVQRQIFSLNPAVAAGGN